MSRLAREKLKEEKERLWRFNDSNYGLCEISRLAKEISDHWIFLRLKDIKQLGGLDLCEKFKYLHHTRYAHSLGVGYLGRLTATYLAARHHQITSREILCVELAGLCHDLGHGAYSHSFDEVLHELGLDHPCSKHEMRSQVLFKAIVDDLRSSKNPYMSLTDEEVTLVQYFIDPDKYQKFVDKDLSKLPKYYKGLEQIVNNVEYKVDIDKMDYILRDGAALQFNLQEINIRKFLKKTDIVEGVWMFSCDDIGTVHELITRRFMFHTNAYSCQQVVAVKIMLTNALCIAARALDIVQASKLETPEDIQKFCMFTDKYLFDTILNMDDERYVDAAVLLSNIARGKNIPTFLGDFIDPRGDLDTRKYYQSPVYIFTDKSNPLQMLPNVRYHYNGVERHFDPTKIQPNKILYSNRSPIKSPF